MRSFTVFSVFTVKKCWFFFEKITIAIRILFKWYKTSGYMKILHSYLFTKNQHFNKCINVGQNGVDHDW